MNRIMIIGVVAVFGAQTFSCARERPDPIAAGGPSLDQEERQPADGATTADSPSSKNVVSTKGGAEPESTGTYSSSPQGIADRPSENTQQVTGAEIESFAKCHVRLLELGQEMQVRLAGGENSEELDKEFQNRTHKIIDDSPLSEKRYLEIAQLTQVDPLLRQRIERALSEILSG